MSPGPALLSGSTFAPRHCPPEWAPAMAASSLAEEGFDTILAAAQTSWNGRHKQQGGFVRVPTHSHACRGKCGTFIPKTPSSLVKMRSR